MGGGSDENPFIVGLSTKALISVISDAVAHQQIVRIVLHMDCTFRCSYNEFTLLIQLKHLICFFFVQKKSKGCLKSKTKAIHEAVKKNIQDLHSMVSALEFT